MRKEICGLLAVLVFLNISVLVQGEDTQFEHYFTLESPNPQNHGWFGYHVQIEGDMIIVNAPYSDVDEFVDAGILYFYDLEGNLVKSLTSPNPGNWNQFGYDYDMHLDKILVSDFPDIGDIPYPGTLRVYTLSNELEFSLESPKPIKGGGYGDPAHNAEDIIIVSEIRAKTTPGLAGILYIYDSSGNYLRNLTSPNPITAGRFGTVIEVSEEYVIVSEYGMFDQSGPQGPGSVYVFDNSLDHLLTLQGPEPEEHACFGAAMSVSGDLIIIGEPFATVDDTFRAGKAYLYNLDGEHIQTFTSPVTKMNGRFGDSVAIDGETIVIGEWDAHVNPGQYEGRAYVYDTDGVLLQNLTAVPPLPRAAFGLDLDIQDDIIVVGECWAPSGELGQVGRVHVFKLGAQPKIAEFRESNLVINPVSVEKGKQVSISIDVLNNGTSSGEHRVSLKIDGEIIDEKVVFLEAEQSEQVRFTVDAEVEGTYYVEVNGLSGSYKVTGVIPGYPLWSIIVAILVSTLILSNKRAHITRV